jgi:hypothetical protein
LGQQGVQPGKTLTPEHSLLLQLLLLSDWCFQLFLPPLDQRLRLLLLLLLEQHGVLLLLLLPCLEFLQLLL